MNLPGSATPAIATMPVVGLGEAASGRWENAITFLEKYVKYNPTHGLGPRLLSMSYANVDRMQESRAMFDRGFKGWPPAMKNVRFYMSLLPFRDLKVAESFAEGYIKAGLTGDPSDIYKISAENRLTGEEVKRLFFGQKVMGIALATGKPWWIERSEDGKAIIRDGDKSDTGKSWIEEDMLCDQWDNFYEGLTDCWVVYRKPEGNPENNDEFLGAPGYGIYPFSPVE